MVIASWSADLSVGVEALDADHQRLIDTMNGVFDAILLGASVSATREALLTLHEYINDHFYREEAWMIKNNYPDFAMHKREHQALRQQVEHLRNLQDQCEDKLTLELLVVLRDWLLGHIAHSDINAASAQGQAASCLGERRKGGERRTVDLGPPSDMKDRRQIEQRRAIFVAEAQLSQEEWDAYFTKRFSSNEKDEEKEIL